MEFEKKYKKRKILNSDYKSRYKPQTIKIKDNFLKALEEKNGNNNA